MPNPYNPPHVTSEPSEVIPTQPVIGPRGATGPTGPTGPCPCVEQFIDVVLDPTTLTTAPFYDPTHSGPGLVVVPPPGDGKVILVGGLVTVVSAGTFWGQTCVINTQFSAATTSESVPALNGIDFAGLTDVFSGDRGVVYTVPIAPEALSVPLSKLENRAIILYTDTDITDNGGGHN